MHCIDGKDYSIFAVLPPYNIVHAQLVQMGEPPQLITSGVTITYEATMDPSGSINTISSTKTNFWSYVQTLFLTSPPPDIGLTGNSVQTLTPHPLTYDSKLGYWTADGIPTVPYDDQGNRNAYGMAKIVARDTQGNMLATASIVLSVSDELTCSKCHASNSDQYAEPKSGWENNPDPAKDMKLNALKKHDDRFDIRPFLSQLQKNGYTYQNTLYQTAKSGTSILCAACHSTNALGAAGLPGIRSMTSDMHVLHGSQINLGQRPDPGQPDRYAKVVLFVPSGRADQVRTRCDEQDCVLLLPREPVHGGQPQAAWVAGFAGLPDVPCRQPALHHDVLAGPAAGAAAVTPPSLRIRTSQSNGTQLYRYSSGHGQLYCSGCHGSPHAEFPTLETNDNIYSQNLQGHIGKVAECTVCHTSLPVDVNNGPHTLHTVGQSWVDSHHDYIQKVGLAECAYCHGSDYRGGFLSKTSMARLFQTDDGGHKNYNSGTGQLL